MRKWFNKRNMRQLNYRITVTNIDFDIERDFFFKNLPSLNELKDAVKRDDGCYKTVFRFKEKWWPEKVTIYEHKLSNLINHKKISITIRPFVFEEDR